MPDLDWGVGGVLGGRLARQGSAQRSLSGGKPVLEEWVGVLEKNSL